MTFLNTVTASCGRLHALAWTGARQAVRDKVLSVLAGFCGVLILLSVIVSQLTVGERGRIVMDLGLSVIALLTIVTAIVLTVNQVAREIDRRTIDTILAKPVARWEFLVGRFLGLAGTLGLMTAGMATLHALLLWSLDAYDSALWTAVLLGWVECLVVIALALFFSSFATPMPSMFITLGMELIGHTSDGLMLMAARLESGALRGLLRLVYLGVPNLEFFNVRAQVVWDTAIPWRHLLEAGGYGLVWIAALLAGGSLLLSRRDLA